MTGILLDTEISGVLAFALDLAVLCVVLALGAAVIRLLRGPTLADRVVALDMISVLLVVFLVLVRMATGVEAYIFVAIGLALISFLGTVAFAGYIDRARGDAAEPPAAPPGPRPDGGAR
jgi:multicomponent Na+:H+ antiporter subunit F